VSSGSRRGAPPGAARSAGRAWLTGLFVVTGFAALMLQVVWQRVISMHSGVDLESTTTVVAAFLGGLGLGGIIGGHLADRAGPRRSLIAFAASNVAIGVFATFSVTLFYDGYRRVADDLSSTWATFAFNAALLLVPTTLMGLSLPLLSRSVVDRLADTGRVVGRLYAANTLGAALGAAVSGWLLLGTLGFTAVTRLAGLLYVLAGLSALAAVRLLPGGGAGPPAVAVRASAAAGAATSSAPVAPTVGPRRVWPWLVAYAGTGAVALGLEQVFFRLIDAVMRSNSYSFAHVLALYLSLFGLGSAAGSVMLRRASDPRVWFLGLQFGAGLGALAGVVVLTRVLPNIGLGGPLRSYFSTDGFNTGFGDVESLRSLATLFFAYVAAPLAVMGLPVFLGGAAYPFVQSIVADRFEAVGRRTGGLFFANVCGNVVGTLLTGFVLINRLGSAGTLRLLTGALLAAGLAAAALLPAPRRRLAGAGAALALMASLLVAAPGNHGLWSFLHGVEGERLQLAEHRTCATALKELDDGAQMLSVNGASQNGYPFDDFHVLIGLVPALVHPRPQRGLAVGLGIGATAYGMLQPSAVASVDIVELCAGQYRLLRDLADAGAPELRRFFDDPRLRTHVGDGRKFLLGEPGRYDIVTVDTLRPQSANSGSLYSVDFYRLIADRLHDDGILAQWAPTPRALNSVAHVFPHVLAFRVASYHGSEFFLASRRPIDVDAAALQQRMAGLPEHAFSVAQRQSLERYLAAESGPRCIADGPPEQASDASLVNRDLDPLDEYFLNNDLAVPVVARCRT
jgi:spermidine synthase/MFS family permease